MPPSRDFTALHIYKINQFWSRDIGKKWRGNRVSHFHFFNIFSGGCCKSVKAEFTTFNDAWFKQDSYFGYYKLQLDEVNGKAHYISSDGKNAIWYSHGVWAVGPHFIKGARTAAFGVKSTADCPTEPHDQLNWKYANDGVHNAGEGFKIVCKF